MLGPECRINSGDQALSRSLFITGGAIDLSGEVQILNGLGLEGRVELSRREIIVFNGVTRPDDVGALESGDGVDQV